MNENKLQSAQQSNIRIVLRVAGPLIAGVGLLFLIIGFCSFFASFGSFEPPQFFWCGFVGMPLLFVGIVLCNFGYLGALQRYVAGESAPVAKDVVNYLGENIQPGVTAVARAVTEGVIECRRNSSRGRRFNAEPAAVADRACPVTERERKESPT